MARLVKKRRRNRELLEAIDQNWLVAKTTKLVQAERKEQRGDIKFMENKSGNVFPELWPW